MKKQWAISSVVCGIFLLAQTASAASLMQVYQQAVKSDPTFKAAYATEMSVAEAVPSSLASLLPQIGFGSSVAWTKGTTDSNNYALSAAHTNAPFHTTLRQRITDVNLNVTQKIFDFNNWLQLSSASASVKASKATYNAAAQDLMQRTAQAYFDVLQARDMLRFTIAEKRALYQEYSQAKEQLSVGVATITDVDNAKAAYDSAVADYITAKNDLANVHENLRSITGVLYSNLSPLKKTIPLIVPAPVNINKWVSVGVQQNWNFVSSKYNTLAAKRDIWAARGGHLPTVSAKAAYDNQLTRTYDGKGRTRLKGPSAEIDLSMPIFSGGSVSSAARKAIADYEFASSEEEVAYRQVINATRKAYLGVMSGISSVRAQQQVVVSTQSALNGNKEGYKVGTSTMVDVLLAQKALYKSQRDYAQARYDYVMSIIALKQSAGTLSANDLVRINSWLTSTSSRPRAAHKKVIHKKTPPKKTSKHSSAHKKTTPKKSAYKKKATQAKSSKRKSSTIYVK